jgi:diadenylate cyclase
MGWREWFEIDGFWAAVRVEDLLDIALVALAISVALSWLRRRSTRPILVVAAIAVGVYLLARWLNLYLTLQLFRVGLIVLLAATLLAYQEDLRRGFERLAAGHVFRRSSASRGPHEQVTMTLTEAAFDLAERRFGALIVVRGVEPLDRHLRAGWSVGAKPSLPLLLSIFDPHTPAHDGAVVIDENGRLERLGVHLPLTSNLAALGGRGTRHAAALGLAEVSDALVMIVSEERGTVSIALGDQIERVATHEELAARLTAYHEGKRPRPLRLRSGWPREIEVKIAAVVLAIGLWFALAAPSQSVQRIIEVPIEFRNVPQGWTLEEPYPPRAEVTLIGPEPVFGNLATDEMRLTIDFPRPNEGENQIPTAQGTVNAPQPLRVISLNPETIWIVANPPRSRAAPPKP